MEPHLHVSVVSTRPPLGEHLIAIGLVWDQQFPCVRISGYLGGRIAGNPLTLSVPEENLPDVVHREQHDRHVIENVPQAILLLKQRLFTLLEDGDIRQSFDKPVLMTFTLDSKWLGIRAVPRSTTLLR